MTQAEVNEGAGFTRGVVGDYECGASQRPPLDVAKKIAKALNFSLDALEQLVTAEEESESSESDRVAKLELRLENLAREFHAFVAQSSASSKPYALRTSASRNGARAQKA